MRFYDGAREKVCRLGLADLLLEVQDVLLSVQVRLKEEKDANGAAVLRKMIDGEFEARGGWEKITAGGIDWTKKLRYNQSILVRLGVELQVSARSDMLIRDIVQSSCRTTVSRSFCPIERRHSEMQSNTSRRSSRKR